ncbi:DUF1640 domain-containing protein [Klebsiella pneumoniae]|nr:DUF1640 domain-containing protein [Klebsiella pneumoniae]
MKREEDVGDLTISYTKGSTTTPLSLTLSNVPSQDFMSFMQTGSDLLKGNFEKPIFSMYPQKKDKEPEESLDDSSKLFSIGVEIESPEGYYTPDFVKPASPKDKQDSHMSDLNRNEIQALLKANKAEVDAVASKMQADMAKWRETMALDMKEIKGLISTQHEKINGRLDMQSTKIESALDSQSKKIDAALSIQEAKIEGKLTEVKLDIIKWALGLPALAFVLYKIYGALTGTP